jgi:hypothetical protein
MSTPKKCRKFLKSGKQCSRNAQFNSDYCWQHIEQKLSIGSPNNKTEVSPSTHFSEMAQLPIDITQNILSDYIDHDQLTEITKYSKDFKVNPNRIRIKEEINENKNITKEIYIDGDLKKKEIFDKDNIKILENNYENKKLEGAQYEWYNKGEFLSERNYKNGKFQSEENYVNGKLQSNIVWYESGVLQSEEHYENGKLEGKHMFGMKMVN